MLTIAFSKNKTMRLSLRVRRILYSLTKPTTRMETLKLIDNQIKLPKLGLVKFAKSREVEGRILNATVRRNPSGKYFVSVLAEVEIHELPKTGKEVGIDVGLKDFAILSNGEVYGNPKFFRRLEEKLARAQRKLSRMMKGSSNWNKQRIKVARIHEKSRMPVKITWIRSPRILSKTTTSLRLKICK